MKQVSVSLRALIQSAQFVQGMGVPGQFIPFDLYTITTAGGVVLTYTTANFPITAPDSTIFDAPAISGSGNVWFPGITWQPIPIDMSETKATAHWKVGLDSDTWSVTIAPRPPGQASVGPPDMIGDQPWLAAVAAGVLDNADCLISRCYFAAMPSYDPTSLGWIGPKGAVPVGTMIMFRGYLGEVDMTTSSAVLTVNDYRQLLQQQMPRNLYLSSCRHRFGDFRCGANIADFTNTGIVSSSSTQAAIVASAAIPAPGGSATYELGILTMTSGQNATFSRMVRTWDSGATFRLLNPFPFAVTEGDTFSISAGCHKNTSDCTAFNRFLSFGGDPYIPTPEISLG